MKRSEVVNYFLEKRTLEGAPGVKVLSSIDDIQNGSIIYFPCISNTELATIEIDETRHCLTHVVLDRGKFFSESAHTKFGSSFPKNPLTMPKRYLKISPEDIVKRGIYHTEPY